MKIIAGNLYDAKKVWTPAVVVTWTSLESSNWILFFCIELRLAHPFSSFSLVKKIVDLQKENMSQYEAGKWLMASTDGHQKNEACEDVILMFTV